MTSSDLWACMTVVTMRRRRRQTGETCCVSNGSVIAESLGIEHCAGIMDTTPPALVSIVLPHCVHASTPTQLVYMWFGELGSVLD